MGAKLEDHTREGVKVYQILEPYVLRKIECNGQCESAYRSGWNNENLYRLI